MAKHDFNLNHGLYSFLCGLRYIELDAEGVIKGNAKDLKAAVEKCERVNRSLSLMLQGMGTVQACCHAGREDDFVDPDTVGWMVSYVGDMQLAISELCGVLRDKTPLSPIDLEKAPGFRELILWTPFYGKAVASNDADALAKIAQASANTLEVTTTNIRIFTDLVHRSYLNRETPSQQMSNALFAIMEWGGLIEGARYIQEECECHIEYQQAA